MNWDIFWGVIALVIVTFGAWSLIRLLNERQASDRSYDGYKESGGEVGGGDGG